MDKSEELSLNKFFPTVRWEEMNEHEKEFFRELPEEILRLRWNSKKGKEIKTKVILKNMEYGKSKDYLDFIGTVETDWSHKEPKIDLRGIDFSGFNNLIKDEFFSFDFSGSNMKYSNFSNSQLRDSNFSSSDILYSDFSNAILDGCNFSKSNLTLTDFSNSRLSGANFKNSWMSEVNFNNARLSYIKYNTKTDYQDIDLSKLNGISDYNFLAFFKRKSRLKYFKEQSLINKVIFYIWKITCDFGYSFLRWLLISLLIALVYGYIYSANVDCFNIDRSNTGFTFYYFSIVTFTTLGFGDIHPINLIGEMLVTSEVILGYLMLGGLISILANKMILKE